LVRIMGTWIADPGISGPAICARMVRAGQESEPVWYGGPLRYAHGYLGCLSLFSMKMRGRGSFLAHGMS